MNHYETLGVPVDATGGEIKAAYRRRAQETHPDREGGNEEEFKRVGKAYEVLGDVELRAQYDAGGMVDKDDPKYQIRQALSQMILSLVAGSSDPTRLDLVVAVKSNIAQTRAKLEHTIEELENTIPKLEKALLRISGGAVADLAKAGIEATIKNMQSQITQIRTQVDMEQDVLALVEEIKYDFDPTPVSVDHGGVTFSRMFFTR